MKARLDYKGAKYNNTGSWGTYVAYYDQPAATIYDHTSEMDVKKCMIREQIGSW